MPVRPSQSILRFLNHLRVCPDILLNRFIVISEKYGCISKKISRKREVQNYSMVYFARATARWQETPNISQLQLGFARHPRNMFGKVTYLKSLRPNLLEN